MNPALTLNQVAAANLVRLRKARGWTQSDLAAAIEQRTGERWTISQISTAETAASSSGTSKRSKRQRQFSLDEIAALARTFEVSALQLMIPPPETRVRLGSADMTPEDVFFLVFHFPPSTVNSLAAMEETFTDQLLEFARTSLQETIGPVDTLPDLEKLPKSERERWLKYFDQRVQRLLDEHPEHGRRLKASRGSARMARAFRHAAHEQDSEVEDGKR